MSAARFMLSPIVQNFKPKIFSCRDSHPRLSVLPGCVSTNRVSDAGFVSGYRSSDTSSPTKLDRPSGAGHRTSNDSATLKLRNLETRFTPAASPPEAHTAVPIPAAPLPSLPEPLQPHPVPPDTGPGRRTDLPSNQKCAPDKYATMQSPWVHVPSAAPVQSIYAPHPCPDSRLRLPP